MCYAPCTMYRAVCTKSNTVVCLHNFCIFNAQRLPSGSKSFLTFQGRSRLVRMEVLFLPHSRHFQSDKAGIVTQTLKTSAENQADILERPCRCEQNNSPNDLQTGKKNINIKVS